MTLSRFFRTPKGLAIIVLSLTTAVAAVGSGFAVAPAVAAAILGAIAVDVPVLRMRKRRWVFPDGALLTGLIVAAVLSPHEPWYVEAVTAAVGVASKYVFRLRTANVFNPAAFGLVATSFVFHTAQSWWGALPEMNPLAIVLLLAGGIFISERVNKLPLVLSFLGGYYALFSATAFIGEPARVAELFREPDLHAALYFAFFMVTDPPTSPPKARDQLAYGIIAATVSYAVFELAGVVYFLLVGLLVANVWEAWRRYRTARHRTRTKPLAMEEVAPASMRASAISKETQGNSFASCPIHSRWRRIAELVLTPGI